MLREGLEKLAGGGASVLGAAVAGLELVQVVLTLTVDGVVLPFTARRGRGSRGEFEVLSHHSASLFRRDMLLQEAVWMQRAIAKGSMQCLAFALP